VVQGELTVRERMEHLRKARVSLYALVRAEAIACIAGEHSENHDEAGDENCGIVEVLKEAYAQATEYDAYISRRG
jgi:hypothetical protein